MPGRTRRKLSVTRRVGVAGAPVVSSAPRTEPSATVEQRKPRAKAPTKQPAAGAKSTIGKSVLSAPMRVAVEAVRHELDLRDGGFEPIVRIESGSLIAAAAVAPLQGRDAHRRSRLLWCDEEGRYADEAFVAPIPYVSLILAVVQDAPPSGTRLPHQGDDGIGAACMQAVTTLIDALCGHAKSAARLSAAPGTAPGWDLGHLAHAPLTRRLLVATYRWLIEASSDRPPGADVLKKQLEGLPLLDWADPDGVARPVRRADILLHHGERTFTLLEREPGFPTGSWRPLIARDEHAYWLARRWFPNANLCHPTELSARQLLLHQRSDGSHSVDPSLPPIEAVMHERFHAHRWVEGPNGETISVSAGLLAVRRDGGPVVELLREGVLIDTIEMKEVELPVCARVNILDDALLDASLSLHPPARRLVRQAVEEAGIALAQRVVEEAAGPGGGRDLFSNLSALNLLAALLRSSRGVPFHHALRTSMILWPTVQGGEAPLSELVMERGALLVGAQAFPSWIPSERTPHRLDLPIAHIPKGPRRAAVGTMLEGLGLSLRDATGRLRRLQTRRTREQPLEIPRLAHWPLHGALRHSFDRLGAAMLAGELELIEGPGSAIYLAQADGTCEQLDMLQLAAPVQAVFRTLADRSPEQLRADVARATEEALRQTTQRLGELPIYVRDHYRRFLVQQLATGGDAFRSAKTTKRKASRRRTDPRDRAAPIFIDTRGRYHSLDSLTSRSRPVSYTTAAPPYPSHNGIVLRLDETEAAALANHVVLRDETAKLERMLDAARRRAAAPSAAELTTSEREACVWYGTLRDTALFGELGLLAPKPGGHTATDASRWTHRLSATEADPPSRGFRVLVEGRPLCVLDDGPGWPVCATIEPEGLIPNRAFNHPRFAGDAKALVVALRSAADDALARWLSPPPSAVASVWVARRLISRSKNPNDQHEPRTGFIAGYVWLPDVWPELPSVVVEHPDTAAGFEIPLLAPDPGPPGQRPVLPVQGHLAAVGNLHRDELLGLTQQLAEDVLAHARTLLRDARRRGASARLVELYRWSFALLGVRFHDLLAATSRGPRTPADLLEALNSQQLLYVAARRTALDLARPDEMVVIDDGSAIVDVLRNRAHLVPIEQRRLWRSSNVTTA